MMNPNRHTNPRHQFPLTPHQWAAAVRYYHLRMNQYQFWCWYQYYYQYFCNRNGLVNVQATRSYQNSWTHSNFINGHPLYQQDQSQLTYGSHVNDFTTGDPSQPELAENYSPPDLGSPDVSMVDITELENGEDFAVGNTPSGESERKGKTQKYTIQLPDSDMDTKVDDMGNTANELVNELGTSGSNEPTGSKSSYSPRPKITNKEFLVMCKEHLKRLEEIKSDYFVVKKRIEELREKYKHLV